MRYGFTQSSRRHKIGRAHALAAIANAEDAEPDQNGELRWVAPDDRGIELEIVGLVERDDADLIVIKHVMPTALRKGRG